MIEIGEVERLSKGAQSAWGKMSEIAAEESRMNARLRVLKTEKDELKAKLCAAFSGEEGLRRLPGGKLLSHTITVVAQHVVEEYSYSTYKEVQG